MVQRALQSPMEVRELVCVQRTKFVEELGVGVETVRQVCETRIIQRR